MAPDSAVNFNAPSSCKEVTTTSPCRISVEREVILTLVGYGNTQCKSDGKMALSGDNTMQGPGQAEIPKNARLGAAGTVAPYW